MEANPDIVPGEDYHEKDHHDENYSAKPVTSEHLCEQICK